MVDFQSRDRDRGADDDETETADSDDATEETAEGETAATDAGGPEPIGYAVVRIADGLAVEADEAGATVSELLAATGGEVVARNVIAAGFDNVQSSTTRLANREDVDAIVTIGYTGVEPDAVVVEAIEPLFDKELPGFGELLRQFEYERVGTATVGDRSTAGLIDGVPLFAVPEDIEAARTATQRLIVPEAEKLIRVARDLPASPDEA